MTVAPGTSRILRFGVFEYDPAVGELRKQGMKIKLQGQPIEILRLLLDQPGEVVTREELQRKLWPADTFVDFEHSLNAAVKRLRDALGDSAENPRYVETLARRGYRFLATVEQPPEAATEGSPRASAWLMRKVIVPAAVAVTVLATGGYFYLHRAPKLSEKDRIVIADFANSTGDAVFDDTLKQGLSVQLEQSPFLDLLSDLRVNETLKLMGRSPDDRLTANVTREVCQRTSSKAMLTGSIAGLGNQYVIGLKAVDCNTGDVLAEAQEQAAGKEAVLKALDKAAISLRSELGESLRTVQKFDTPLEQATTPSLEALEAYSLARRAIGADNTAAVRLLQRVIRLDPNFAIAYAALGTTYRNLGESSLATENMRKAYELREHVSEREKFYIESHYYGDVTGNMEKGRQGYELWAQTYPRDSVPHTNIGDIYRRLGQHDKALTQYREAFRLDASRLNYLELVVEYLDLNRLAEARATAKEAQAKNLDSPTLHYYVYLLAFLQNDAAEMAQQVAWSAGQPGIEEMLLASEADTAAYSGRLRKAREFSRRAVVSAERAKEKEVAAGYEAGAALREALFGNAAEARLRSAAALGLSAGRSVQCGAALALAFAGDASRARALADDLARRFPEATVLGFICLPTIYAQLALDRNDASKAIEALQAAASYELGGGVHFTVY